MGEVVDRRDVVLRNFMLHAQVILLFSYWTYTQTVIGHFRTSR